MPRIRTIKPEYWQDEKLSVLDPVTRLVFLGLISMADDAGRLVDNVKLLDGQLFPATDDTCRSALERLAEIGRIVRYRSDSGQQLLQIANWRRHQKIDHPSRAVLPGPDSGTSLEGEAHEEVATDSRTSRANLARPSRSDLGPRTMDPGSRTSDLRSSTSDHGPTTAVAEERSLVLQAAITLAREANRGLAEHPDHPQSIPPIIASGGNAHQAADEILAAGVPIDFAAAKVYELARGHRANGAVSSLRYFTAAIVRAWEEHQAAADVAAHPAAGALAKAHEDPYVAAARALAAKEAAHA